MTTRRPNGAMESFLIGGVASVPVWVLLGLGWYFTAAMYVGVMGVLLLVMEDGDV